VVRVVLRQVVHRKLGLDAEAAADLGKVVVQSLEVPDV